MKKLTDRSFMIEVPADPEYDIDAYKVPMIDMTGVDQRELIQAVYDLSQPQGLGLFAAAATGPGPLTDAEIDEIMSHPSMATLWSMDYVNGRSCKFHLRRVTETTTYEFPEGVELYTRGDWYDHGESDLHELLTRVFPDEAHS